MMKDQLLLVLHLLRLYLISFLQETCTCRGRSLLDECRMIDRISRGKQCMAHCTNRQKIKIYDDNEM